MEFDIIKFYPIVDCQSYHRTQHFFINHIFNTININNSKILTINEINHSQNTKSNKLLIVKSKLRISMQIHIFENII